MQDAERFHVLKTAWQWRLFSIGDIILATLFLLSPPPPTAAAKIILVCVATLALGLGVMSWVYLKTYVITIGNGVLTTHAWGMAKREYQLLGLVDLRMRNFYLTLDYGEIPRKTILFMTQNNRKAFEVIAAAAGRRVST